MKNQDKYEVSTSRNYEGCASECADNVISLVSSDLTQAIDRFERFSNQVNDALSLSVPRDSDAFSEAEDGIDLLFSRMLGEDISENEALRGLENLITLLRADGFSRLTVKHQTLVFELFNANPLSTPRHTQLIGLVALEGEHFDQLLEKMHRA